MRKKYVLDQENATQFAKILSKKIWPNRKVLDIKYDTHPATGKARVMIMSPEPLKKVEEETKKFMFLHGKMISPMQLIPIE